MKSEIDNIRAAIVERFERADLDCRNAAIARDIAAAELALLARVEAMIGAGGATPAAEPKPERHAVQSAVMALFGPGRGTWGKEMIVAQTGLPEDVVHGFLVRAVRQNKLRRDGDVYSLPRPAEPVLDLTTDLA